jgi:hypothetical protein
LNGNAAIRCIRIDAQRTKPFGEPLGAPPFRLRALAFLLGALIRLRGALLGLFHTARQFHRAPERATVRA